jgi:hypothetical protein
MTCARSTPDWLRRNRRGRREHDRERPPGALVGAAVEVLVVGLAVLAARRRAVQDEVLVPRDGLRGPDDGGEPVAPGAALHRDQVDASVTVVAEPVNVSSLTVWNATGARRRPGG